MVIAKDLPLQRNRLRQMRFSSVQVAAPQPVGSQVIDSDRDFPRVRGRVRIEDFERVNVEPLCFIVFFQSVKHSSECHHVGRERVLIGRRRISPNFNRPPGVGFGLGKTSADVLDAAEVVLDGGYVVRIRALVSEQKRKRTLVESARFVVLRDILANESQSVQ